MAILHAKQVIQRFRYSEIQYRLLTFESRMSSGDNGWVVYCPEIIKEAVMISSPGDFCYSRNNPDTNKTQNFWSPYFPVLDLLFIERREL